MAWIPKYKSEGLFSPFIPHGSLTSLMDLCVAYGNNYETTYGCGGNYETWSGDHLVRWSSRFGFDLNYNLTTLLKNHPGQRVTGVTMAELTVENPEGAQFYKQTLTLIGGYEASAVQRSYGRHGDEEITLDRIDCEVFISDVYRREYPTPYSAPVSTAISIGTVSTTFSLRIDGYTELEPLIYFLDKGYFTLSPLTYQNKDYMGFGFYTECERGDFESKVQNASGTLIGIEMHYFDELFGGDEIDEQDDPNEDDDEDDDPGPGHGGSGGGNGELVLPDYPITIPPKPVIGPCSVSWLTTYMMSAQDLDDFGQDLVNPDAIQKLKQFFNDPLDAIVGITMCPAVAGPRYSKTPTIHGTVPYEWSRSFMAILNQYVDIDCGIVSIDPFWDSCFDFDPYTRFTLFLPFIGYRDINADEIMGTNVHILYRIDVVTGDCTAYVAKAAPSESMYGPMPDQIIAQFNGNCGVSVPIGRVNKDAAMQASFSLLAGAIGMGVGGAAAAAGLVDSSDLSEGQLASQVTHSTMTAVNAMKTKIERSGAISGNAGYLGYLRPYFIRKLARQSRPDNYKEIMGYPCNKPGPLRNYRGTGLAVVEDIQLNEIPAFGDELAEIISLLKGGVLI